MLLEIRFCGSVKESESYQGGACQRWKLWAYVGGHLTVSTSVGRSLASDLRCQAIELDHVARRRVLQPISFCDGDGASFYIVSSISVAFVEHQESVVGSIASFHSCLSYARDDIIIHVVSDRKGMRARIRDDVDLECPGLNLDRLRLHAISRDWNKIP